MREAVELEGDSQSNGENESNDEEDNAILKGSTALFKAKENKSLTLGRKESKFFLKKKRKGNKISIQVDDIFQKTVEIIPEDRFQTKELQQLWVHFNETYPDGRLTRSEFITENMKLRGGRKEVWNKIFEIIDDDGNGYIDFQEYVIFVSTLDDSKSSSDLVEQIFDLVDLDGNGSLDREELEWIVNVIAKEKNLKNKETFGDDYQPINVPEYAKELFKKMDEDGNGVVDREEFMNACLRDAEIREIFSSPLNQIKILMDEDQHHVVSSCDEENDNQQFNNAVGGHASMSEKIHETIRTNEKGDEIWKPFRKEKDEEYKFYEEITENQNGMLSFCPKYFGRTHLDFQKGEQEQERIFYIRLENLTYQIKKPCILDIKMGKRGYDNNASFRKILMNEFLKNTTLTGSLGFRICGLKVWKTKENRFFTMNKRKAGMITMNKVEDTIVNFINNGERIRLDLLRSAVQKLQLLLEYFQKQNQYKYYSSSILFVYDGAADANDEMIVKTIDFAHVDRIPEYEKGNTENEERDFGYITGLRCLIELFLGILAGKDVKKELKRKVSSLRLKDNDDDHDDDHDEKSLLKKAMLSSSVSNSLKANELKELWIHFNNCYPDGRLTRREFINENMKLRGGRPEVWDKIFDVIDDDGNGYVDFQEYMIFISTSNTNQSSEDVLQTTFDLCDLNGDGSLDREEMEWIVRVIAKEKSLQLKEKQKERDDDEHDEGRNTIIDVEKYANELFQKMDKDGNGVIDRDEFISTCLEDPEIRELICTPLNQIQVLMEEKHFDEEGGETFDNAVGGHASTTEKMKQTIRLSADGKEIMKPFEKKKDSEFQFYEEINETNNPVSKFCPKYYGRTYLKFANGDILYYIRMQNLTYQMKKPCILDIKMGKRGYDKKASFRKILMNEFLKNTTLTGSLGFRLCGIKVWKKKENRFFTMNKRKAGMITMNRVEDTFTNFINNGERIRYELAKSAIRPLKQILKYFKEKNDKYYFYSSSILFIYDGANEDAAQKMVVKMVDFAHIDPIENKEDRDEGYIAGLECLIQLFEAVSQGKSLKKKWYHDNGQKKARRTSSFNKKS